MALDSIIVELAFSIPVWRQKSQLLIICSMFHWTLEQILLHQVIVPRATRNIADMFSILLQREGIEPNPGPIPIADPEQRLYERLQRILHGSKTRAGTPSFASFRKCLAEVSRDAQMTRTPGDGMNTPPPEPKPPDGGRSPGRVYKDTAKDIHPRTACDVSTHSEFISSRSVAILDYGQVRGVDRNESHYATHSISGSSLDISYINAQARAESRVAANTDDDFYCYISSSEEDVNSPNRVSSEDRAKQSMNMWKYGVKNVDGSVTRSINDEMSDDEREISYCPTPSISRSSLDVDHILAQARAEPCMAANMDDDFYCNDSDSGEDEVRSARRKLFSLKDTVGMDGERRNNPPRPVCESSENIEDICAQARLESRTAYNMDDDFFTNSECSDVDESCMASTSCYREDDMSKVKVRFADVKLQRRCYVKSKSQVC